MSVGAPCVTCGHGEGHHRFGYAPDRRTILWETPCQIRECKCPAFVDPESRENHSS